ncbi:MAG: hypothetical protein KGZ97_13180 [Bacteroidetes bacterium]|nr:hypothetical protein [Bacteroidota bacterium]
MKKTVNSILSVILALNLLLSFAGVRLLVHNCHHCNSTEYFVFFEPDHDCCGHNHEINIHKHSKSDCCSTSGDTNNIQQSCDNCCSTDTEYVKADYNASVEKTTTKIWVASIPLVSVLTSVCCTHCVKEISAKDYYDKPPYTPTGKDFIIFSHNIKIC